jgi:hypothetical protein
MFDIFISYSKKDQEKAKPLADALKKQGWSVWWDPEIPPGRSFDEVIEEALKSAKCLIVLWSKNSVKSRWVKNEAALGLELGILVPALIENVSIPFAFRDIEAADLVNWQGEKNHPEFNLILKTLRDKISINSRLQHVTASNFLQQKVTDDNSILDQHNQKSSVKSKAEHWFWSWNTKKTINFAVIIEIFSLWVIALGFFISPHLRYGQFYNFGPVIFLLIIGGGVAGIISALWLGVVSWINRFRMGVVQGLILPLLIILFQLIVSYTLRNVFEDKLPIDLLISPIIITFGGYMTFKKNQMVNNN